MAVQKRFLDLSLPPEKGENWVAMQIEERWRELLQKYPQQAETAEEAWQAIGRLKNALHYGKDPEVIGSYRGMPEELKQVWVELIYKNTDRFNGSSLEELIKILGNPALGIPSQERSRRVLTQLKVLAENMGQLERNTNFLLRQVLNGGDNGVLADLGNHGTRQ